MRFAILHVIESRSRVAIALGPRAHQDGALDFFGMTKAELLGNDRSHRNTNDLCFFNAERIHQTSVVIRHHFGCVITGRLVREANAAVVRHDAAVIRTPVSSVSFPVRTTGGDAHDQDQRITFSELFVIHLDSVRFCVWHDKLGVGFLKNLRRQCCRKI